MSGAIKACNFILVRRMTANIPAEDVANRATDETRRRFVTPVADQKWT
jgi:hypothetical protein